MECSLTKRIYVGNLPFSSNQEELEELFSQYGEVLACVLPQDRDTGRPRGFGFIEMATDSEAHAAIDSLNGTDYDGRPMKVNEAKPQEKRSGGGRGGYGGGGNRW